ncbi:MAG: TrkH family potassium uptake protein [Deltaproteobacteria bacterium]|nr:MAG: TrkH family potassium uptake protein [Deltaproteobacteria bacterium]
MKPTTPAVTLQQAVARPVGAISIGLGISMLLCALSAPLWTWTEGGTRPQDQGAAVGLVLSGMLTLAAGGALFVYGRHAAGAALGRREAILVVSVMWILCGMLGGLPYVLDASMGPADALFEAISGFTTTGSTVVSDIEGTLSRPTLLWRALTQWFGGMGIIVLFVAIFPNIGVGARHLYRSEAPGLTVTSLQPRIAETGRVLWQLYVLLTLVVILLYKLFGMTWFEAVCHAFTTMPTGGFSTLDSSLGGFDAERVGWWNSLAIEWTAVATILLSGMNYAIFFAVLRTRSLRAAWRSTELRAYLSIVAGATLIIGASVWWAAPGWDTLFASFRQGLFTTATSITSTGYSIEGYRHYPTVGIITMIFLLFIGGSAGSTAGGIKIVRIVVTAKLVWAQVRQSFRPNVVQVLRMDGRPIDPSLVLDVSAFLAIYAFLMLFGIGLVGVTDGVSVPKAFGAMLTTLSNMGPAPFHEVGLTNIDPEAADNFSDYSNLAKLWFTAAMIVGRLEFFTLLALFLPDFWKR